MKLTGLIERLSPGGRFNRDVLWNVFSLGILGVSGIALNVAILAWRDSEALGIFNQVFACYIIVSQLAVGGLQFSTLKHCSHAQDDLPQCATITTSALVLVAAVSLVICLLLFSLRDLIGAMLDSPGVAQGLAFAIPGLFLFSLNKVLNMALNGLRNMRAFAVFQALRYVFIFIAVIVIMRLGYSDAHLPLSLTLAELVLFLILIAYINARLFRIRIWRISEMRRWFRRHLSFGYRGFLSGVLVELNTRVDILMLGYFLGDALVGVYSFAATFAEGLCQLPIVVRRNVDPILGKHFADHGKSDFGVLSAKVKLASYIVIGLISVSAIAVYPFILRVFRDEPALGASWTVFAILTAGLIVSAGYRPFLGVLIQGGRPGMHTVVVAAVVCCNVILNAALIPWLQLPGAAVATALAQLFEVAAIILLSRRLFRLSI